ncbi:DNA polymerase IV [uncultured Finegoldia sp.]|uniref:DNA polymerase IV n=1 Tax=uncultured Finegoldia sp. TaxID=328009 RepID=UPI00260A3B39|nr:DNA polymerase IV [uncultured Finegoldia sp.]
MDLNFLHFDLDAFFASCEILDNPQLKHIPMVVGGRSQRGIITTANYEARKYGLHSAMPIFQARKIVPNLVIVKPDFEKYRQHSENVFKVLSLFSSKIQKMSIDEGCMDISHIDMGRELLAKMIQDNVRVKTGLSISIGISYNMSLAKLASDWNKPHGIKIITEDDIPDILMDLDVGKIQGIGKKSEKKLNDLGIKKVCDLYDLKRENLVNLFGKFGEVIYERIRGIDSRKLELSRIRKSIGVEYTFERDIKNYAELIKKAKLFSEELSIDLKNRNLKAKTIRIKIKLNDFTVITKSMTLDEYIKDSSDILRIVKYLAYNTKIDKPVRLLGITAANLSGTNFEQLKFL